MSRRRATALVDDPRVPPSVQQRLTALRMTVGSRDAHRSSLVRFCLQRRPTSEQLSSPLEASLSDRHHDERGPSIGVCFVFDAPVFQEGSHLTQVSISCRFVYYIDLVDCHDRWRHVVCWVVSSASRNKVGRCDMESPETNAYVDSALFAYCLVRGAFP